MRTAQTGLPVRKNSGCAVNQRDAGMVLWPVYVMRKPYRGRGPSTRSPRIPRAVHLRTASSGWHTLSHWGLRPALLLCLSKQSNGISFRERCWRELMQQWR
jgi:hypothetical protein